MTQAWPNEVYEHVLFLLWGGLKSEEIRKNTKEEIEVNYNLQEVLKVVFHIDETRNDKIKNLCKMRTLMLLNFDKPVFEDDSVIISISKEKLIEKIDWLKEYFVKFFVENDQQTYFLWLV